MRYVILVDDRAGMLSHEEGEVVFGIFLETRADGTTCIGEQCYLRSEVTLVPVKEA